MSELVPAQPLDVVAWVTVRLHQSGTISTTGTIADKVMAKHLLTHAIEAVSGLPNYREIIVPASQVEVSPSFTTRDMGDIPMLERGTP